MDSLKRRKTRSREILLSHFKEENLLSCIYNRLICISGYLIKFYYNFYNKIENSQEKDNSLLLYETIH